MPLTPVKYLLGAKNAPPRALDRHSRLFITRLIGKVKPRGEGALLFGMMEGFAGRKELRMYVYRPGAFYLGDIHPDHGLKGEAGIFDDRHLFIVAGSRSGKGTSMIMPNLIRWEGGAFVIDPKGEAASITAVRRGLEQQAHGTGTTVRRFLNNTPAAILDPFGTVRGPARAYCVAYDPLSDLDIAAPDAAGMIDTITEGIITSEEGSGAHFSDSAATILAGVIEAVKITRPPAEHTLPAVRAVILGGFDRMEDILRSAAHGRLAPAALDLLTDVGEDELGSFKTTLSRNLKWLADPRMQTHLAAATDFSLRRAVREGWSVYVCIPPRMIGRYKRWLRAIVNVALDAKMDTPIGTGRQQSLFILDEFAALGHFSLIEDAAAYMAGYGIKLVPVIQNLGQVRKHYGNNWETFLANAGAIIGWGLNDKETETYLADRLGAIMTWETGLSDNSDPASGRATSFGTSTGLRERPVRWPSEIHTQGARGTVRAFVIPADTSGFTIARRNYFENGSADEYDAPDAIQAWEAAHAQ